MSQKNVEPFKRFVDGFNRRDVEAMLEEVDAGVDWRPAAPVALGLDPREALQAAGLRE